MRIARAADTKVAGRVHRAWMTLALLMVVPELLAEARLTSEYLAGKWCYVMLVYEHNPPEHMNRDYLFTADGTFTAGLEGVNRVTKGQYEILPDGRLKLGKMPLKLEVKSVSDEGFHLGLTTGQAMVFEKGSCSN